MLSNKVAKVILKITVLQNLNEEDLNHTLFFLQVFFLLFFAGTSQTMLIQMLKQSIRERLTHLKRKKNWRGWGSVNFMRTPEKTPLCILCLAPGFRSQDGLEKRTNHNQPTAKILSNPTRCLHEMVPLIRMQASLFSC